MYSQWYKKKLTNFAPFCGYLFKLFRYSKNYLCFYVDNAIFGNTIWFRITIFTHKNAKKIAIYTKFKIKYKMILDLLQTFINKNTNQMYFLCYYAVFCIPQFVNLWYFIIYNIYLKLLSYYLNFVVFFLIWYYIILTDNNIL